MPPTNFKRQNKRKKGVAPELRVGKGRDPHCQQVTITTLHDDLLLEIFDFILNDKDWNLERRSQSSQPGLVDTEWQTLVHVCRRWRHVVFASPLRLNLELCCTEITPARKALDVWPALPLVVASVDPFQQIWDWSAEHVDNIVAALKHNDRVRRIDLGGVQSSLLEIFMAVIQGSFPALTSLNLEPDLDEKSVPVLPESFLRGYTPRLQELFLPDIPTPIFSKLPVSSPNLADLRLWNISFISPKTMVNCLSALTKLKSLVLEFHSPLHPSLTDRTSRRPPPLTRIVLPSLTLLQFRGVSEYLEELVSRIDIPLLEAFSVTFFNQLTFDISQLPQFISRTERFKAFNQASVGFYHRSVKVRLAEKRGTANHGTLNLEILSWKPDWQLSSVTQVFGSLSHRLSTLEDFGIYRDGNVIRWPDDMESTQWLELLHPFTTVKYLFVSGELVPHVSLALEDLPEERVTEVIPALEHLFLADFSSRDVLRVGPTKGTVKRFIAARQLLGHPVTVHRWDGRHNEGLSRVLDG